MPTNAVQPLNDSFPIIAIFDRSISSNAVQFLNKYDGITVVPSFNITFLRLEHLSKGGIVTLLDKPEDVYSQALVNS